MFGLVTRNADELTWPEFDRGFYEVKDVTGRRTEPVETGTNMISCFGDTARGKTDPSLVPVSVDGDRATRERPFFDWGFICPSSEDYRAELLDLVETAVARNPDVRIDDIGFPRAEYCYCERCQSGFATSAVDDREAWRTETITSFVKEVSERVPGRLSVTVYPDPYPGHLEARSGVDPDALAPVVDEFVVPIYDMSYATTYWVEVIAKGFESRLSRPFSVEVYAVDVDVEALAHAAEVASAYARGVFFAYDAETAREALERLGSRTRHGTERGE